MTQASKNHDVTFSRTNSDAYSTSRKTRAWLFVVALASGIGSVAAEQDTLIVPAEVPQISDTVVMLYYKDITAATAFYGQTLGLEMTFSQDAAKLFRLTPTSVVGVILEGEGSYHKAQPTNAVMLSIVTPDVDAWYDHLKSVGGITFLKPIATSTTNPIRAFLIEDPGGYSVEFFSWLNEPEPSNGG